MTTYNFDVFGNPVRTTASGKLPATVLYGDGVYDPALAAYCTPIRCQGPVSGLFASPDTCAGEVAAPASLRRFGYAGETPIHAADPV